jgi:hypothetical protein
MYFFSSNVHLDFNFLPVAARCDQNVVALQKNAAALQFRCGIACDLSSHHNCGCDAYRICNIAATSGDAVRNLNSWLYVDYVNSVVG